MRLAAAEMVEQLSAVGERHHYDAIFVTSLMSAADLRALLPAALRNLPLILYMHENQAAYPESPYSTASSESTQHGDRDVHFALTNLTSILAADRVFWNSQWNLRSYLAGIESLLRRGSDVQVGDVRSRIEARSAVIWPPVEVPEELLAGGVLHNESRPVNVAWPHRWEHDKGPDELLAVAERWSEELDLRWTILGERYDEVPRELEDFEKRFRTRINHFGYEPNRNTYLKKLRECDWVLSTARHEFFGIAVVEAMLVGCLPWLPNRLSYPELLPPCARGLTPSQPPADPDAVRRAIRSQLAAALVPNAVSRLDQAIEKLVS